MRGCFLCLLLCLAASGLSFAQQQENPVVITLASESKLLPLYVSRFKGSNPGLDSEYIAKLEKILRFDLGCNGMTCLAKNEPEKEKWLEANPALHHFGKPQDWQKHGILYVLKVQIESKGLNSSVMTASAKSVKKFEQIALTGDLQQDRKQIHLLADAIHKALFGSAGIASTKFLYTLRTSIPGDKPAWASEVYEADYDGANARAVTKSGGYIITPTYVPPKDGYSSGSFFYVSYKTGQPKLYVASVQEGEGSRFSYMKGNQLMPAISRQRDMVAFISDITGNPDLFIQEFNPEEGPKGKPRQIFSSHKAVQGSPSFSPDGKGIAFVSNKDGSPRIYVMEIPSPGVPLRHIKTRLITQICKENTCPAWSPDGSKIAYSAMTEGVRQIWIYDLDSQTERQLTQGPGHKENPTWAPNSLHLMFNSTGDEGSEIYLLNLNQPNAIKIALGEGEKRFPNWEP